MIEYFYLYGFINGSDLGDLAMRGIYGLDVLVYEHKGYSLVYSIVNKRKIEAEYGYLIQHESVLERLMENYDVLPFSFSTILLSQDSIRKLCEKYDEKILANFRNISGKVEMGIKIICHKDTGGESKENSPGKSSGYDYMLKKLSGFKDRKKMIERAKQTISIIEEKISGFYTLEKKKYSQSSSVVLNAAYLIKKEDVEAFKSSINDIEFQDDFQDDFELVLSGPWPPYNFVDFERKDGA
ncbi:MAG: hypothetical protein HPY66_1223 [Firmicutes bacterium]|nr:hypothetical protein [Bacillota bacterium]MDI6704987.1 GvpL/GvpF family gas vesicle protein [Bacillota bacterium]